jgi:hypothetical protein
MEEIIKLVKCPLKVIICEGQRNDMNHELGLARQHFVSKEFTSGLKELDKAYASTFTLENDTCKKCAFLYRNVIIDTCGNTVNELHGYTRGIFKRKKYLGDLKIATELLQKMKQNNIDPKTVVEEEQKDWKNGPDTRGMYFFFSFQSFLLKPLRRLGTIIKGNKNKGELDSGF